MPLVLTRPTPLSQFSKIGKVMRHIHNLTDDKIPRDVEFKFRERAKVLVEKWHDILNANKSNGDSTVRKPAANGKAHSEEAGVKSATEEKASPSQEPAGKPEGDAMEVDAKEPAAHEGKEAKETKEEER